MYRPGRPKKPIVQERGIGFFVTNAQYAVISQKIKESGVNISDYMRQAAMAAEIRPRWPPEDRQLFKDVVSMSNDLHELVKLAKKEGVVAALVPFEQMRAIFDQIIERIGHDQ